MLKKLIPKKKTPKSGSSDESLYHYLRICDKELLDYITREYRFSESRHRFDFAFIDLKIGIECDGGRWAAGGGRHASCADYAKLNKALLLGWKVLRFTSKQINDNPIEVIKTIRDLYEIEKNKV